MPRAITMPTNIRYKSILKGAGREKKHRRRRVHFVDESVLRLCDIINTPHVDGSDVVLSIND